MPLRLIVAADGSWKGVVVGNVDSLGNAEFLDSERSDDILGVDGPQKGEMVDNLNVLNDGRWNEIFEAGGRLRM